jgi:hypothetical protein
VRAIPALLGTASCVAFLAASVVDCSGSSSTADEATDAASVDATKIADASTDYDCPRFVSGGSVTVSSSVACAVAVAEESYGGGGSLSPLAYGANCAAACASDAGNETCTLSGNYFSAFMKANPNFGGQPEVDGSVICPDSPTLALTVACGVTIGTGTSGCAL